jgi:hypothetical protein
MLVWRRNAPPHVEIQMEINITTPALLFPAISLLMLAFTNRFLGLASVIRNLHATYKTFPDPKYLGQIGNLRRRIYLTRSMQFWGLASLILCTVCMFVLFAKQQILGKYLFAGSLICMIISLCVSVVEIQMSIGALDLHLQDIEKEETEHMRLHPPKSE